MTNKVKGNLIKGVALTLDVGAPLIATITQFPIWVERSSEATVSGIFVVFALLSVIPFLRQIKAYFKSPAVWSIWCILFVLFVAIRNIIDEMLIICLVGFVSNVIGAIVYKLGNKVAKQEDVSNNTTEATNTNE